MEKIRVLCFTEKMDCDPVDWRMSGERSAALGWLLALLATLPSACHQESSQERRARIQRELRARRLDQVKRRKELLQAKQKAHARYLRDLQGALHPVPPSGHPSNRPGPGLPPRSKGATPFPQPAPPRSGCTPDFRELARRSTHTRAFRRATWLLLAARSSHLVRLGKQTFQSFRFVVRMHPADEPRMGRHPASPKLVLHLLWSPICASPSSPIRRRKAFFQDVTLRLGHRSHRRHHRADPRAIILRAPDYEASRSIEVGTPVELLIHSVSPLWPKPPERLLWRRGRFTRRPATAAGVPDDPSRPLGRWLLLDAQFSGRKRLARLHLPTHALGPRLARLAAVEVSCPAPIGSCRFLTLSAPNGLEHPLSLESFVKRAAPIHSAHQARQLFNVLRALRYYRCSSRGRHSHPLHPHPCLHAGKPYQTLPCRYYRAVNGYRTRQTIVKRRDQWLVSQTLRCELPSGLRILSVEARIGPRDAFHLVETDLTARSDDLEDQIQRLSHPPSR